MCPPRLTSTSFALLTALLAAACGGGPPGPKVPVRPEGEIIQLVFADSNHTFEYECPVVDPKDTENCALKGSPDDARFQLSRTKHIRVEEDCGGKFWRIQLERVQSAKPIARVVCAQ